MDFDEKLVDSRGIDREERLAFEFEVKQADFSSERTLLKERLSHWWFNDAENHVCEVTRPNRSTDQSTPLNLLDFENLTESSIVELIETYQNLQSNFQFYFHNFSSTLERLSDAAARLVL